MNRQQKESVVEGLHALFSTTKGSFFVDYQGLSVSQMRQLRAQLRETGGTLKVAKMRLVKRAIGDVHEAQALLPYCKDQMGVVFAQGANEVSPVAKTLRDFSKENESLQLVVGCLDAQLLDKQAIVRIASLPSKEVLLAQLCGTINAPLTSFVGVLNQLIVRFLRVLKEIEKKQALGS
jgi:large subunit ribosomal protein L10